MRKWFSNRDLIWAGVVSLVLLAVFAQTYSFGYIFLDDNEYTYDNPFVRGGLSWAGIAAAFKSVTWGGIWMPLTYISYMADISLFGAGASGHHIASVVLHLANTILFYWFLRRVAERQGEAGRFAGAIAAAFALLWAVHPMRAESVAWIASRKDLVFLFFILLGSHAWLSHRWCAGVACMVLGVMGKPTAMAFPAVALAIEFCLDARPEGGRRAFGVAARYGALLVVAVCAAALATYSQTHVTGVDIKPGIVDIRGLYEGYGSFAWRCLNAAVALGMYFWHAATGRGIHILYLPKVDARPDDLWLGLASLAVVTAAVAWAFFRFRAMRAVIAGCALWFLGTIGPTLGVAGGFGCHAYADRFTYWPMMAFSVIGVVAAAKAMSAVSSGGALRAGVVALSLAVAYYGWAGYCNAATYRANVTLWEQAAISDPRHYVAYGELGAEYCRMGRVDEGIALLRYCLGINRRSDIAAHLADTLATRGRMEDFAEIKELCSHVPEGYDSDVATRAKADDALGTVAMFEGRWDEAIARFTAALGSSVAKQLGDDTPMRLAMCYFNTRRYDMAKPILTKLAASKRPEVREKAREMLQIIWNAERPPVFLR